VSRGETSAGSGLRAERAEVEAVLASDIFLRSPTVAQMLKYICEQHLGGQGHDVKEYNIAVEAFGRPPDFDQSRDSIVRVEAHRLRKRLQEYYSGGRRRPPNPDRRPFGQLHTAVRAAVECRPTASGAGSGRHSGGGGIFGDSRESGWG